jgi:hypothetical protein
MCATFEAGLAPVIIFSGGIARPTGPSAGAQMGRFAMTLGVPQDGVIAEGLAQSTLQNALFSLPLIPNAERRTYHHRHRSLPFAAILDVVSLGAMGTWPSCDIIHVGDVRRRASQPADGGCSMEHACA